jgi:hypothetical protein
MNGLRAGMSAAPLMAAARGATGVTSPTCQLRTWLAQRNRMKRGSCFYAFKATEYADFVRPRLVDHQAVIAQRRSGTSVGAAAHRRCVVARK